MVGENNDSDLVGVSALIFCSSIAAPDVTGHFVPYPDRRQWWARIDETSTPCGVY